MGHLRPLGWNLGSIHKYWTSLIKLLGSNTLAYLDPPLVTKKQWILRNFMQNMSFGVISSCV
jgi:hypothetical protein